MAALRSSCLHDDSLPQPHAEKAVIYNVAAVVLVNQLLVSQRCESGFDAAQSWQTVFLLGHLFRAEAVDFQRLPLFRGQNCTEIASVQKFHCVCA
jgi:hypothetical protein